MKFPVKLFCVAGALGALLIAFGGCEGDVAAGGPVVYGDVGYVGPWYYPDTWFGGGDVYVHPPYDHGHAVGGRPGRSIPNNPRPSGGARGGGGRVGGGGGDRRR
jgi:hypothetical protein